MITLGVEKLTICAWDQFKEKVKVVTAIMDCVARRKPFTICLYSQF